MTEPQETPQEPVSAPSAPEVDIDALMDEIVKDDPQAAAEPARAGAPGDGGGAEGDESPAEGSDEHDEGVEPGPAEERRERSSEAEKALKAAKVAGLPESALDSMSDDELERWHIAKLKNDADVRRAFQENAELRQTVEELRGAKAAERDQAPAVAADSVPKELAEELGDEGARALVAWQQQRETALRQEVGTLTGIVVDMYSERVLDAMAGEDAFGQELSAEARAAVKERADALSNSPGPWDGLTGEARLRALFRDAGRLVLDPKEARGNTEAAARRRAVAATNGTVKTAPGRKKPPRALTADEAVDTALDAIVDRGIRDVDSVKRELAGGG